MAVLHRGISAAQFAATGRCIRPASADQFEFCFRADGTARANGNATAGPSVRNAVYRHEVDQKGWPESPGISTTPSLERAKFYATHGGQRSGFVVTVDRSRLHDYGIREHVVADELAYPSVPEDAEVILVTPNGEPLPDSLIVAVTEVRADD